MSNAIMEKNAKKTKHKPKPKPPAPWSKSPDHDADAARPADYSFKKLKEIPALRPEQARLDRLGVLEKGPSVRLLSRGVWLNHNRLTTLRNLHCLVKNVLEYPERLGLLDISCNQLTELHDDLFRFPNITVLYLHGNKLHDPKDIFALRKLPKLQHLTVHANPWCDRAELGSMRHLVATFLPNLAKLDNNRFTALERSAPLATHALKILIALEGRPPEDWLFKKFPIPKMTPEIREHCQKTADEADAKEF